MIPKRKKKLSPLKAGKTGRSLVSKGPARDEAHLDRVRSLPCYVCGYGSEPSEAHHIRECYLRTMGVRVGDDKVVPLCSTCHRMLHRNSRHYWSFPDVVRLEASILYAETLRLRNDAQESRTSKPLQNKPEAITRGKARPLLAGRS